MKRFLVAIIVAAGVIPSGCAPITIPLQGTYEDMMYLRSPQQYQIYRNDFRSSAGRSCGRHFPIEA